MVDGKFRHDYFKEHPEHADLVSGRNVFIGIDTIPDYT
jgi:hypothetical protein